MKKIGRVLSELGLGASFDEEKCLQDDFLNTLACSDRSENRICARYTLNEHNL